MFHSSLQRLSFLHTLLPIEMTYVYGLCSWRTHTLVSKVTQHEKVHLKFLSVKLFLTARFNLWAIQWILTNGCPTNSSSMVAIDDLRPKLTLAPSLTKDFILSFMISVIPSSSNAAVMVPVCPAAVSSEESLIFYQFFYQKPCRWFDPLFQCVCILKKIYL